MNQSDKDQLSEIGRKLVYEKPAFVELGGIRELTLGGPPSTGLDTSECTRGEAQTPPPRCL